MLQKSFICLFFRENGHIVLPNLSLAASVLKPKALEWWMSYTFSGLLFFFRCRGIFHLAVAKSINRCQFETGFSPRGVAWVAFWKYQHTRKKQGKSHTATFLAFAALCFLSPDLSIYKLCVIIVILMWNKTCVLCDVCKILPLLCWSEQADWEIKGSHVSLSTVSLAASLTWILLYIMLIWCLLESHGSWNPDDIVQMSTFKRWAV